MLSKNEWDSLKSVIVGSALNAKIPNADLSLRTVNYADKSVEYNILSGPYPSQVIDEAQEDLNGLAKFLQSLGIEVFRPDDKQIPQYYNYCPRDTVLVHDDTILSTPCPLRSREHEWHALAKVLSNFTKIKIKSIQRSDSLYNLNCLGDPDTLALTDVEPAFDAANILRDNDNLYYLVSNSGNLAGAAYLQEVFPKKKVWPIRGIYSYMHLDSTIALLREGLMLLNPSRIKSLDQLPKPLQSWNYIWCPEPVDIGYYPGYCNASKWINMNLLSVNTQLVILEENQHPLRKELEKYKIESAMLPMRHQRTLGGGFHCVTLDLVRDNK